VTCTVRTTPLDVILLDAHYRQTVATMRVYGRAGLRVGAVSCDREYSWAPALKSRWCSLAVAAPDLTADPDGYVDVLLRMVKDTSARLVVPAHDGSIEALRLRRDELEYHTLLGMADEQALSVAVSKSRSLALATELGMAVPRSISLRDVDDVRPALRELGMPAVIKPEQSWVAQEGAGIRLSPEPVCSVDGAVRRLEVILAAGGGAVLQEWIPGRREAVSLFFSDGRIWARMAQVSHREWPILGGGSVLCTTIPLPDDVSRLSERLVRTMGLEGCSMVEYRRDRRGQPVLMEVNPRMGGSVALAIAAGVNFPQLLADWKLGRPLHEVGDYEVGRRLRWLPGDLWHLRSVFASQGQPDVPTRARAVAGFIGEFRHAPTTFDVVALDDPQPAVADINAMVLQHVKGRLQDMISITRTDRTAPAASAGRGGTVDVAIVGAGPNGLGLAAHLHDRGVRFRIFGSPMQTWHDMPKGMYLKSLGFATSIPSPSGRPTFPQYCQDNELEDYEPIEFSTFAAYGMAFQREYVPEVEDVKVTHLTTAGDGFVLTLESGEEVHACQVVVAVGLTYFPHVPEVLAELPADRVTHTWGHVDAASFSGQDVVVVGGGSSALETATLLHESGSRVQVLARSDVHWGGQVPKGQRRPLIERIKMPLSSLGHGRENWVLQHVPWLMHYLPSERRIRFTRRHLGPAPAWWLHDRAVGQFPIHARTSVVRAFFVDDKVHLWTRDADGEEREVVADRVVAGTGYVFDVDRISFIGTDLARRIERHELAPKLSRHFESSVPGLFFVGPIAAESFGPLDRFVAGAPYVVPKVATRVTRRVRSGR
jgi:cation diffusion facilitator CzcD-associated flavoprotein CzcO/predicted ATP-grasp superfamily ATP-dependent carboligase